MRKRKFRLRPMELLGKLCVLVYAVALMVPLYDSSREHS